MSEEKVLEKLEDATLEEVSGGVTRNYLAALDVVLQSAQDYYTVDDLRVSLRYTDGRWQIVTNPSLLRALAGGIAY